MAMRSGLQAARATLRGRGLLCFPLRGESVSVLTTPQELYQAILNGTEQARSRITMTSLYLGTGKLEDALVASLLSRKKSLGAALDVHVVLDVTRGTRGRPASSVDMLRPVAAAGARVSLYNTPQLRGMLATLLRPPFNEVVGLQHTKLYVFDDITVLTGANLSNDYFTQRQDRCMVIRDARLADFCCNLAQAISTLSLTLEPTSGRLEAQKDGIDPRKDPIEKCWAGLGEALMAALRTSAHESLGNSDGSTNTTATSNNNDTWVYPLLQMGRAGVDLDETTTPWLLGETEGHIDLASGYFNLSPNYASAILTSRATTRVLAAAPSANGFLGAKGIRGHIPAAYTYIEGEYLRRITQADKRHKIQLLEYARPGWTFHAKGVWLRDAPSNPPYMTLIGSSNFGQRSAYRDVEAQFAIVSEDPKLQAQWQTEVDGLLSYGTPVTEATLAAPERRVVPWEKLATRCIASFL